MAQFNYHQTDTVQDSQSKTQRKADLKSRVSFNHMCYLSLSPKTKVSDLSCLTFCVENFQRRKCLNRECVTVTCLHNPRWRFSSKWGKDYLGMLKGLTRYSTNRFTSFALSPVPLILNPKYQGNGRFLQVDITS